ncbi:hypothetical protein B5T_00804 [Alloalcanivorax dieselolei B5]|uniref:Uncharacterized protein n=1 Tax=Alcanivorax dieselolei (strain DSM 16502 / CGMCC 1.3690 / MCCC 1A00001 / B-5) TaxID=930169 RepID=K0C933_ALCDB|nr:hypothetical protein B5T_00804 [Alloalcanivorax dieselolei B5]
MPGGGRCYGPPDNFSLSDEDDRRGFVRALMLRYWTGWAAKRCNEGFISGFSMVYRKTHPGPCYS